MNRRSFAVCMALFGCLSSEATAGDRPVVPVVQPGKRKVTDYADFTGRTAAVDSVELRARVTGYLLAAPFKEGAEVKKGDVLFEIDPRPYKAELDKAQAQVDLAKTRLKLAQVALQRDLDIARTPGAISRQQLDQDRAAVDEAQRRLKAAQRALEVPELNLYFTKVRAPIDGRVSRYYVTPGNLVTQDQTVLTTVVSLDPLYVYFDMDEATYLGTRRAINAGKLKEPAEAGSPVEMELAGEKGYPHVGKINFLNNQINVTTGTITVRAVFANPRPLGGVELMVPGMAVRVRLPVSAPYEALAVPASAVQHSKEQALVFVVNAKDTLEARPVQLGPKQPGALQVIRSGITADDRVVLNAGNAFVLYAKGRKSGVIVQPTKTLLPEDSASGR